MEIIAKLSFSSRTGLLLKRNSYSDTLRTPDHRLATPYLPVPVTVTDVSIT